MRRLLPLLLPLALAACRGDLVHHRTAYDPFVGPPSPTAIPPGTLVELGQEVPDFVLSDLDGERVRLSDLRGNRVVLEWLDPDCPFSRFAHEHGALRTLARELRARGVLWLAVNSAGEEKPGGGAAASRAAAQAWGLEHPVLLDPTGEVGRMFDATTTPEVFLIDERGVLVYVGALDNAPFGKVRGGGEPLNYLEQALGDLAQGRPVAVPARQSYGCRIKYAQPVLQR
ncbi:MAG: redoxin domain-containing protein [Planctomycetes bacterium]|nr:redoxin domain-containing protein [Planctomycetota bacterium]